MYDSLMKSGKWTAAQNKVKSEEDIDSISELVAMCERQGFIPKYTVDGPQDKADRIIEDMQKYTHDLIANETNLNILIERAGKQMAEEAERIAEAAKAGEDDETVEEKMFSYAEPIVTDDDIMELAEMIESEALLDDEEDDY